MTYPLTKPAIGLGVEVKDVVSGMTGISTSLFYKLSGSIMIGVQPPSDDGKMAEAWTIDEAICQAVEGGRTIPAIDAGDPLVALGHQVEDRVTKFKGTVTAIMVHINGCISCVVTAPKLNKDGGLIEEYFDQKRLVIKGPGVSKQAEPKKQAPVARTGGSNMRARGPA